MLPASARLRSCALVPSPIHSDETGAREPVRPAAKPFARWRIADGAAAARSPDRPDRSPTKVIAMALAIAFRRWFLLLPLLAVAASAAQAEPAIGFQHLNMPGGIEIGIWYPSNSE